MAIDFDGTGDAIDFGTAVNWSGGAFGSITGWFQIDALTDARGLNKSDGFGNADQTMKLGYASTAGGRISCIISETEAMSAETIALSPAWNHISVTYDGSNVRTYLNGIEVDSAAKTGNVNTDSRNLRIGSAGHSSTDRNVNGRGHLFEIWDRTLSPNEILTMCRRTPHGIVLKRLYAWKMREKASGAPAATGVKNFGEKAGGNSVAVDGDPVYVGEEFPTKRRYK